MKKLYITKSAAITPRLDIKTSQAGKTIPTYTVDNKQIDQYILNDDNSRCDRVTKLATACANKIKNTVYIDDQIFTQSLVCIAGSARGATETLENSILNFHKKGTTSALTSPLTTSGGIASAIANLWQIPPLAIGTSMACASFFEAILIAESLISTNRFKRALICGAEAALTDFTIAQMQALKLYSPIQGDSPCQPFAKNPLAKNTMVLGEGAGCFLLESDESILETGNIPILELTSIGYTQERNVSLTGIDPEGESFFHAMLQALSTQRNHSRFLDNNFPDAIFVHAPGTEAGDNAEFSALTKLAKHLKTESIPVYCTKSIFGHTFGASSALSLAFAIDAIKSATILRHNYQIKDQLADVDFNNTSLDTSFMINSAGFGGVVGSMLFKAARD